MNKETRLILETLSVMLDYHYYGRVQLIHDQKLKIDDALGRKDDE